MTLIHSTFGFSGILFDGYMDSETKVCYATLTSFAKGLTISRHNVKNWLDRYCKEVGLPVTVGKFNKVVTVYTTETIFDFLDYRLGLGDKQVQALFSAVTRADLESSIKESNGVSLTTSQHEETRSTIRVYLINR
jgi:hypothetical protein